MASKSPPTETAPSERVFSLSIVVSAVRCTLAYVVLPWVLPAAGLASGIGSGLGLAIGTVAIVFNVMSIRRFWSVGHRFKWPITALNSGMIVLLLVMAVVDLSALLG